MKTLPGGGLLSRGRFRHRLTPRLGACQRQPRPQRRCASGTLALRHGSLPARHSPPLQAATRPRRKARGWLVACRAARDTPGPRVCAHPHVVLLAPLQLVPAGVTRKPCFPPRVDTGTRTLRPRPPGRAQGCECVLAQSRGWPRSMPVAMQGQSLAPQLRERAGSARGRGPA